MRRKKKGTAALRHEKRRKPGKHSRRYLAAGFLAVFFAAVSFGIYYFSDSTVVQALFCSGNFYYSPQQVYRIAGLSVNARAMLMPQSGIEKTLEADPLIKSARITKDGRRIMIEIDEELVVGYTLGYPASENPDPEEQESKKDLEQNGSEEQPDLGADKYMVLVDGRIIPIDDLTQGIMAHFPYLGTLSLEQINMLCQTVQKYPEQLTRAVLEKIAEIEPWEESYDKNMLKIIMQDGNTVFSNYDSLFMLSEYQTFLPNLEGTNVCLSLDGEFGVIAKQACSGFYTDPLQKAQNRTIPKEALGQKVEENKPEDEKPQEDAQPESQPQESQPSQENPQPASEDTEQTQLPETEQKTRVETDDWQECSYSWLVYSPSKDVYQSKYSDDQYVYDDTIKAFRTLE